LTLFVVGASTLAFGAGAPEIDPGTGGSALALLAGAVLLFRSKIGK
jgi:hypothetical protein